MKMDEEWPDHFEEHSRPSRAETEEAGERKLDAMANMIARPQSLQDYLRDQLGWFEIEPALRAMCERIIYNLDSNGYLQGRLEDLLGAGRDEGRSRPGRAGPGRGAEARPARRGRPQSARMPAAATHAGHAPFRAVANAHHLAPGGHRAQPPAGDQPSHRLFDRADPAGPGRVAEAQSQAGGRLQQRAGPARHARRVRRTGRRRQVPGPPGRRPHAQPLHQPLLPQAVRRRAGERRDPRVHQAEDQFGPMADRLDPAAAEHAHAGCPGDRRSPDRVPQQGPRGDRAA